MWTVCLATPEPFPLFHLFFSRGTSAPVSSLPHASYPNATHSSVASLRLHLQCSAGSRFYSIALLSSAFDLAMASAETVEPFMGMKVRRRSSMYRVFSADYIDVPTNSTLVKLLSKQGDKQVLFADNIMKVNRKCKLVRRILLITDVALYILDSTFYHLKHRIPLQNIEKVSLSELSDNFFAISIPSEYDYLMASTRKSEIVTVLVEAVKQLISSNSPEDELQVKFSNSFEYYIDAEHVREVLFESVEGGGIKTRFVDK